MAATLLGAVDWSADDDITFETNAQVIYAVQTTDSQDGPLEVLAVAGLPAEGDVYDVGNDVDSSVICVRRSCKRKDNDPLVWLVTCNYTNRPGFDPTGQSQYVFSEEPDVAIGGNQTREPVSGYYATPSTTASAYDRFFKNSAGEMLSPAPEMDVHRPSFTISYNVSSISPTCLAEWANAVNATTYMGAAARQFKMAAPTAQVMYDENVGKYWKVTYTFEFRRETWDKQVLNYGSIFIDASGNERRTWEGTTGGTKLPEMVLLTSTGGPIEIGSTKEATFTTKRVYHEKNFNLLGFSSTLFQ